MLVAVLKYLVFLTGVLGLLAGVVLAVIPIVWPSTPTKPKTVLQKKQAFAPGKTQNKKKRRGPRPASVDNDESALLESTVPEVPPTVSKVNSGKSAVVAGQTTKKLATKQADPEGAKKQKQPQAAQAPVVAPVAAPVAAPVVEEQVKPGKKAHRDSKAKLPTAAAAKVKPDATSKLQSVPAAKTKPTQESEVSAKVTIKNKTSAAQKPKPESSPPASSPIAVSHDNENNIRVTNHEGSKNNKTKPSKAKTNQPPASVPKPATTITAAGVSSPPTYYDEEEDLREFVLVRSRKEQRDEKKRAQAEEPVHAGATVPRAMPSPPERTVERIVPPKWFVHIPRQPVREPQRPSLLLFGADLTQEWEAPIFDAPMPVAPAAAASDPVPTPVKVASPLRVVNPPRPAPWSAMVHAPRVAVPFPLIPPDHPPLLPEEPQNLTEMAGSQNDPPRDSHEGYGQPEKPVDGGFWN